jgi:hypothetical protein
MPGVAERVPFQEDQKAAATGEDVERDAQGTAIGGPTVDGEAIAARENPRDDRVVEQLALRHAVEDAGSEPTEDPRVDVAQMVGHHQQWPLGGKFRHGIELKPAAEEASERGPADEGDGTIAPASDTVVADRESLGKPTNLFSHQCRW